LFKVNNCVQTDFRFAMSNASKSGGTMSELKHELIVKEVGVDNDCLCIDLLNGLRLVGPLRTKPIYREPVVPTPSSEARLRHVQDFAADPAI
jgi:hypothetical protein